MTDKTPDPNEVPGASAAFAEEVAEEEAKRARGMLTDTDREYLWGVKTFPDTPGGASNRSHRRADIRGRVIDTLLDLSYLSMLEDGQPEKIMQSLDENTDGRELRDSVSALVEFLYQNVDQPERWIELAVSAGIGHAIEGPNDSYGGANVDVEIDVDPPIDLAELEQELRERPHNLTAQEVGILVREGRVDGDDLENLTTPSNENGLGWDVSPADSS
jgi:hypothetical protein